MFKSALVHIIIINLLNKYVNIIHITLYILSIVCYNIIKEGGKKMNLDDLKKLSEIFNNFAQPIATVIASWIGAKIAKSITKSNEKKKKK